MPQIASLFADLSANSAVFAADMRKAQAALRSGTGRMNRFLARLDTRFLRTTRRIGGFIKRTLGLRAALASTVGGAGLALFIKRSVDAGAAIAQTADKIGFSTDALQELRAVADDAGVGVRQVDLGLQRFSRRVGEAAQGTGELRDTLAQYGIEVVDAEGKTRDMEDVLGDYADVVKNAESEQEQLRLAFKAFDSEGAALVNVLRNGRDGLAELRQEARDAGRVIDERLVRSAETASNKLGQVFDILKTNFQTLAISLAPSLAQIGQGLIDLGPQINRTIQRFLPDSLKDVEALKERIRELNAEIADFEGRGDRAPAGKSSGQMVVRKLFGLTREELEAQLAEMLELLERAKARADAVGGIFAGDEEARKSAAAIAANAQALQFELDQLGRTKLGQDLYNRAKASGVEINETFVGSLTPLIRKLNEEKAAIKKVQEQERAQARQRERIVSTLESSTESAFQSIAEGGATAAGVVDQLTSSFRRLAISLLNRQIFQLLSGAFGGFGGGVGAAPAGGFGAGGPTSSPGGMGGFQHGGSFRVPGTGAADSRVVQFRASPRERVTVTPAGRSGGGNLSVTILPPAGQQAETEETTDAMGNRDLRVVFTELIADDLRGGGAVARAARDSGGLQPRLVQR